MNSAMRRVSRALPPTLSLVPRGQRLAEARLVVDLEDPAVDARGAAAEAAGVVEAGVLPGRAAGRLHQPRIGERPGEVEERLHRVALLVAHHAHAAVLVRRLRPRVGGD